MQEQPSKGEKSDPSVADDIEKLAYHLREAEHLEPEVREQATELLGDLAVAMDQPSTHTEDLVQKTAQLVRAVQNPHQPGLIEAARDQLEEAIARAETTAPVATDIVLRLIDVLAGIGI